MSFDSIHEDLPASAAMHASTEVWSRSNRGWMARLYGALSGALGTIAGITPHVLHHVGPIAGAALLTGTGGSILFGAIGFVLTVPLLYRLKRRFRTWLAPGIALAIFAVMFTVSTLWIGPAIRDAIGGDDGSSPVADPHHAGAEVLPSQVAGRA